MKSGEGVSIGVDTGGTFTDVVCRLADGRVRMLKVPSTRQDPSVAVLNALQQLHEVDHLDPTTIARFAHGTTVATNAVLERKGAVVGLVTTQGFRDVLEIGRQIRRQLYASILKPTTPIFLAPRRFRREVAERIAANGSVLCPLDETALEHAIDELVKEGCQSVAVCFLFSFLNPAHERRVKEILAEELPDAHLSISHEVVPQHREYERFSTTALNAYIGPKTSRYLRNMHDALRETAPDTDFHLMASNGGTLTVDGAVNRPTQLLMSGPVAGIVGGIAAATLASKADPGFVHNGALAGLVAVCAGSDVMHPIGALITGAIAEDQPR